MAGLSFRPRALDINKQIPIIRKDIEQDGFSSIARSVPEFGTGMEEEEEKVCPVCVCVFLFHIACASLRSLVCAFRRRQRAIVLRARLFPLIALVVFLAVAACLSLPPLSASSLCLLSLVLSSLSLFLSLTLCVRVQERHIKEAIQRADVIATVSIPIPRVVAVPDYEESFGPNAKAFARPSGYIVHIGAHARTPSLTLTHTHTLAHSHSHCLSHARRHALFHARPHIFCAEKQPEEYDVSPLYDLDDEDVSFLLRLNAGKKGAGTLSEQRFEQIIDACEKVAAELQVCACEE